MQRKWLSREAAAVVAVSGEPDPIAAVNLLAKRLLDEADLGGPPFQPEILASFQGIADVQRVPMVSAARLFPRDGALHVEVNEAHSPGKQNFSIDHEVTHTLLPTYRRQPIDDRTTGEFSSRAEEEYLCDVGASALLLDPRWLRPQALDLGPSIQTLLDLASLFKASLQATARKLSELDLWPCAFIFWEEGLRKPDRLMAGQPILTGLDALGPAQPKLRVRQAYPSESFSRTVGFIPRNKSVADGSLVASCTHDHPFTQGLNAFDFGRGETILNSDNLHSPYKSNGIVYRRVISLVLSDGARPTRVPQPDAYQIEIV